MTKPKTQVIDVPQMPEKWSNLLAYLQNRIPDTFILEFPDEAAAKSATSCIYNVLARGIPGPPMIHTRRGRMVYIIKTQNAQKVIIRED